MSVHPPHPHLQGLLLLEAPLGERARAVGAFPRLPASCAVAVQVCRARPGKGGCSAACAPTKHARVRVRAGAAAPCWPCSSHMRLPRRLPLPPPCSVTCVIAVIIMRRAVLQVTREPTLLPHAERACRPLRPSLRCAWQRGWSVARHPARASTRRAPLPPASPQVRAGVLGWEVACPVVIDDDDDAADAASIGPSPDSAAELDRGLLARGGAGAEAGADYRSRRVPGHQLPSRPRSTLLPPAAAAAARRTHACGARANPNPAAPVAARAGTRRPRSSCASSCTSTRAGAAAPRRRRRRSRRSRASWRTGTSTWRRWRASWTR